METFEHALAVVGLFAIAIGTTFGLVETLRMLKTKREKKIKKIVLEYLKTLQKDEYN